MVFIGFMDALLGESSKNRLEEDKVGDQEVVGHWHEICWVIGKVMTCFFMFFNAKIRHYFPDDPTGVSDMHQVLVAMVKQKGNNKIKVFRC